MNGPGQRRAFMRLFASARGFALPLAVSIGIAVWCIAEVLDRAGEPALPLDDAFIHLQYAQRLSQGHWFSYSPGASYSSGATSVLWPMSLAPFFVLGLDELDVVWIAWLYGVLLHAGVAIETTRVAEGIGSRAAALGAGAMCLGFGAFAWFTVSGMETMALAWVLMRGLRVASEHADHGLKRREVIVLGLLAPLVRPEGVVVSVLSFVALLIRLPRPIASRALVATALPLVGPLLVPAMHAAFTGRAASSTAVVKWLALDPYLDARGVAAEIWDNVVLLATDLLAGGAWTWLFLVEGFVFALAAGVLAMAVRAWRGEGRWRLLMVALALAGTLLPCTYATMLWNRVRYIWPFAPIWFAVASCFAAELGRALSRQHRALGLVSPAVSFGLAAALATRLPGSVDDVAQSARAIARQQMTLGRWARDLPAEASVGVNDTGAIAYLSGKHTFDVVGLTTAGEARFWAEGAGSRFEHYESLDRGALPTHFVVYPGWMAMPAVLGEELTEATVLDQSILGGHTMVAYLARYDLLGSGSTPYRPPRSRLIDELDVADIASEEAHAYERLDARARFNVATLGEDPEGREVADGGRVERWIDRFELRVEGGSSLWARVRVSRETRVEASGPLEVWIDMRHAGEMRLDSSNSSWQEHVLELPPWAVGAAHGVRRRIEVATVSRARFASYHYWIY